MPSASHLTLDAADASPPPEEKSGPVRLPRQLSDPELELFRAVGEARAVASGETIFRKGELGRSMFVIESGEIHLEFGDGLASKVIGEREFLGELALFIGDHAREASGIAKKDARLRVIDQVAFEELLNREPLLLAKFMRRSFTYLVASEQQLVANLKRRNEDLISTLHSLRQTQTMLTNANNLVRTDELTGLTNRRGLYQFLESLPEQRKPGTRLALFLVDLDSFKTINDQFGHLVGDRALCLVAELRRDISANELCCRLGGDEFALLVHLDDAAHLGPRATAIAATIRALQLPAPHDVVSLTVSIGANLCDDRADWSTWYSEADRALYAAKGEGGDGWRAGQATF